MKDDIRRHPNGCIDFDFYRAQGVAMRREAMRGAALGLVAAWDVLMAGAIGYATVLPPAAANSLTKAPTPRRSH